MRLNFKSEKGVIGADALLAIVAIVIFASLILAISYNIYLANASLKRMSKATNFITDVFEHVDKLYYDDVTQNNLVTYCQGLQQKGITVNPQENTWSGKGYKIDISVQSYVPESEESLNENDEQDTLDLVKEITMTVTYKLSSKEQSITMTRIKKREVLLTPNKPDLTMIELEEDEVVYPIKRISNAWVVTDSYDSNWYNYQNGIWAVVIITEDELSVGDKILFDNYDSLIWVPRYAYKPASEESADYKFTYQATESYIDQNEEGYNILQPVDTEEYTIYPQEAAFGKWIEEDDLENENLNFILQMRNI